jgi:hypothetical protein
MGITENLQYARGNLKKNKIQGVSQNTPTLQGVKAI